MEISLVADNKTLSLENMNDQKETKFFYAKLPLGWEKKSRSILLIIT